MYCNSITLQNEYNYLYKIFDNSKSKASEYLSKDILDEDFLNVFSYFNTAQRILGSSRVDAKDCFVSPPKAFQKLYTIICYLFFSFLSYVFGDVYTERYKESPYVGLILQIAIAFYILVCLCNMIHVRFLNNEANVKMYIKMQEVDRTLGIGVHKDINKILRFEYNATILSLGAVLCILLLMFVNLGLLLFGLIAIMYLYGTVTLETVYCINLSAYFIYRLRFINAILANYVGPDEFLGTVTTTNVTKRSFRQLASRTHDFRTWDVDIHLKALFQCFEQFQNLYRFQVLLSLIIYITTVIIAIEFITVGLQSGVVTSRECILNFSFIVISTIHAALLCFRLEIFLREIKETKSLCIRIMSICFIGPIWYKVKKTLKIIEDSAPSFKVYDMLEINADTMMKLISFVTVLIVTLLQFAIL